MCDIDDDQFCEVISFAELSAAVLSFKETGTPGRRPEE